MKRDFSIRSRLLLCIVLAWCFSVACPAAYAGAGEWPEAFPVSIKTMLLKLKSGMTDSEVLKRVKESYPDAKEYPGDWSGQTGYIDYSLGGDASEYQISIAYTFKYESTDRVTRASDDKEPQKVVYPSFLAYVYNHKAKQKAIVTRNEKHEMCVEVKTWQ